MPERIDDTGFGGIKLIQDTEMFCYGVDAVLLADFATRRAHKNIIDLGTNNAAVPLLMCGMNAIDTQLDPDKYADFSGSPGDQQEHMCDSRFKITALEVQKRACEIARRNVALNGLSDRISVCCADVADAREYFDRGVFDCVVTNPPYMAAGKGIINDEDMLTAARHETTATLADFIRQAAWLLSDRGYFYMIHRPTRIVDIAVLCRKYSLEPKLMQFVSPRAGKKPNLMLLECRKNAGKELKLLNPLYVYGDDGNYSEQIRKIYSRKKDKEGKLWTTRNSRNFCFRT